MGKRRRNLRGRSQNKFRQKVVILSISVVVIIAILAAALFLLSGKKDQLLSFFGAEKSSRIENPEETLLTYFSYIENKNYEKMYQLLDTESKQSITIEDFVSRNQNIYEGIEVSKMITVN
jgi:penicillin-binding protein 3